MFSKFFIIFSALLIAGTVQAKKCLFINSYHTGYGWSDGVEKGLEAKLGKTCDLTKFYLDTKNNKEGGAAKAAEVKALIEKEKFDVVLTCDDNAIKLVVIPFLKEGKTPVVFSGVNWNSEPYQLKLKHITGMEEIAPIQPILQEIKANNKTAKTAVFISADNESEQADFKYTSKLFEAGGIKMDSKLVKNFEEWKTEFKAAQDKYDVVFLNNDAGIKDYNKDAAKEFCQANSKKMSVGVYEWMGGCTTFTMMKDPTEQGEFLADAATKILAGTSPDKIPVKKNFRYNPAVTPKLIEKTGLKLTDGMMKKSVKFD